MVELFCWAEDSQNFACVVLIFKPLFRKKFDFRLALPASFAKCDVSGNANDHKNGRVSKFGKKELK